MQFVQEWQCWPVGGRPFAASGPEGGVSGAGQLFNKMKLSLGRNGCPARLAFRVDQHLAGHCLSGGQP